MSALIKNFAIILSFAFTSCGAANTSKQNSVLTGATKEQGYQSLEADFRFDIKNGQSMSGKQLAREINVVLLSTFSLQHVGYQCFAHLNELIESGRGDLQVLANLTCTATGPQKVTFEFLVDFIKKMSVKSHHPLEIARRSPNGNIGVSN